MWLVYTLLACVGFGLGAALQKHGMSTNLPQLTARTLLREWRRVLGAMLRNWVWLLGIAAQLAGGLAMILAVAAGEVSAVQPLVNLNLLVAVLIGVVFLRERLHPLEWVGAAVMLAGAVLVSASAVDVAGVATHDLAAPALDPAARDMAVLWVSGACVALVLFVQALRGPLGRRLGPEVALSINAGLLFGLGAVALKMVTIHQGDLIAATTLAERALALAADPAAWGLAATNAVGFVLFQMAFSHGRVSVVSPVTTIFSMAMPVVAGVTAFSEAAGPLRLLGVLVIVPGVVLLVSKPGGGPAGRTPT